MVYSEANRAVMIKCHVSCHLILLGVSRINAISTQQHTTGKVDFKLGKLIFQTFINTTL
jgi:hypothetical protein